MKRLLLSCGVFFTSTGCAASTEVRTMPGWPDQPYLIYIPAEVKAVPEVSRPLVISLHGYGSNGEEQQINSCADGDAASPSCLDRLADKEKIVVVYPNGKKIGTGCRLPNRECFPRKWRPIGGCAELRRLDTEQAGPARGENDYLAAVLADVKGSLKIDSESVYFSGMSNGATMAFDISCQLKDQVAGVALIAGTGKISETCSCLSGKHPSILQFHGTADPVWPYESSQEFVGDVARVGECKVADISLELPDIDPQDHTTVMRHSYQKCQGGDLIHYQIIGGGHTWPGGFLYSKKVGRVTHDISANEIMWEFFKTHKKEF